MEDEAVIAGLATFGSHSIRNRSCLKPPRLNSTDKFAIPTSTAIGPSGVKQRRKNRFSREQTKRANVSQAIWKIRFALQACDLQEWQTENQGSHRTQHRKKGLELASVNQGSKQVADMSGNSTNEPPTGKTSANKTSNPSGSAG